MATPDQRERVIGSQAGQQDAELLATAAPHGVQRTDARGEKIGQSADDASADRTPPKCR